MEVKDPKTKTDVTALGSGDLAAAMACILDDIAEIRAKVDRLSQLTGLGAADLRPVTVKEAAVFLSVTERAVNKMVREQSIPHYERNGTVYFFERELLEWVKQGYVKPFSISNLYRR